MHIRTEANILDDKYIAEEANRLRAEALLRPGATNKAGQATQDWPDKPVASPLLNYFELSYRGKFMRTLYSSPLMLVFLLFPSDAYFRGLSRNGALGLMFVLFVIQACYNYYKWKSTEQGSDTERIQATE
jgi:hypothetical protein